MKLDEQTLQRIFRFPSFILNIEHVWRMQSWQPVMLLSCSCMLTQENGQGEEATVLHRCNKHRNLDA